MAKRNFVLALESEANTSCTIPSASQIQRSDRIAVVAPRRPDLVYGDPELRELSREDGVCSSSPSRQKRRTPDSTSLVEPVSRKELSAGQLQADELDEFSAWIHHSAYEPPPVAGAGAAKKTADDGLRMFRDRRVSYPPVFPVAIAPQLSSNHHHQQQHQRPVSTELSSPTRKTKTARIVDDLIQASVRVSLPLLSSVSPVRSTVAKDKATLHQLLHESHLKQPDGFVYGVDRSNQNSGRATTADRAGEYGTRNDSPTLVIPDSVFFEDNSFVGRVRVDLSDWACLCGRADTEVYNQIATKLSSKCEQLNLRGLDFSMQRSDTELLFKHCSRVHTLDLSRLERVSKHGFVAIALCCPLVETLSLAETDALTDDLLSAVLLAFPRLKNLDISHCVCITDAGVQRIAKVGHKLLEGLRLDHCSSLSDYAVQSVIKAHGPKLRILSLRGLHRVSDATVKQLFVLQPKNLQELNFSGCVNLTDACFEFLATVPSFDGNRATTAYYNVQRVDISDCKRLTSLACCFIAASCPFLSSFRAARCVALCDKATRALASLTKLEELDLSGCAALTDRGMETFLLSNGLQQKTPAAPLCIKPLKQLMLANCKGIGPLTVAALVTSAASSSSSSSSSRLSSLDLSGIGDCPGSALVKLVKANCSLRELRCTGQRGITRAVVAHLATSNTVLQVLDIRECPAVDDLALYPLAVMQSLVELRVSGAATSGGDNLTTMGLQNLPSSLRRLSLIGFPANQITVDGYRTLFARGRLPRLETLDMTHCTGLTIQAIDHILQYCPYLRSLNVDGCDQIKINQLARALHDDSTRPSRPLSLITPLATMPRQVRYELDVIDDETSHFRGIAAVDAESSKRSRQREESLAHEAKRRRAASSIQVRFRSRARAVWKAQLQQQHAWQEFCAAVDIQRIVRGCLCRRRYAFIRKQATRAVIYIQYLWRQKLQQRRIRKATSYWTNQTALKFFLRWKQHVAAIHNERELAKATQHAAKALNFWGEKTLVRIFAAWRAHVQKKTVKAKKAIGFWKCQSLPRVLEAWTQWTRAQQRHRELLIHVFLNAVALESHNSSRQLANVAKANYKAKRVVFRLWRAFMVDQKRFLLKASLSILSGSLLHWSFRQWRQNVRQQQVLRDKHRRLLRKIVNRDLYRTWLSWREFLDEQRAKRRAFLKFSNSVQTKCWLRWKAHHDQIQHLRSVSSRVAARLLQQQLVRAVDTWFEFAQQQIDERQRKRRALAFFLNATLIRTFTAWADLAAYLVAFRKRWRARLENANVHYALSQWIAFTRARKHMHACATRLQAFWRGHLARRQVEDHYLYLMWATVLIQTAWRCRLARAILRVAGRKARLREYLRAERERDAMDAEETHMRKYNRELELIVALQRMWRGVAARSLYIEMRRARIIVKKQQQAELQEIVRAQARQRQLDRIQREKHRQLAAIEIQRHARGYIARQHFKDKQELLRQQRYAARLQAVYRGRMSRRRTAALRRSYLTRMEILTRRAVEGQLLRTLGAKTRSTQNPLRSFLSFFGLDPATFLTDIRDVLREVREDFSTLKQFFDVVRARVQANLQADKEAKALLLANEASPPQPPPPPSSSKVKSLLTSRPSFRVLKKSDTARKFLRDLEQIVSATATEKEQLQQRVRPGDAVRVVLRGHPRCGETAFVLSIQEEIAQVKLDVDGELEFFPLVLPATKMEPAKRVLHCVPDLTFDATSIGRSKQISQQWRDQLEAYAKSIEAEAKRFNAARVIQCAVRVYLARMRVQTELELQGVNAARRQQALVRILKTFKLANTRMASVLVQLHFVRPLHVPKSGLTDEPLEIQKIVNRFQRYVARRQEINQAVLRLVPEQFKGTGVFHGGMMPVPPVRVMDKLVHYPLRWIQRVTRVPMARMLEKQGMFEMARFFGGVEFVKSFEEQHVVAREHFFEQLQNCSFCPSEGFALVHGVFQKRQLATDTSYVRENRIKKLHRTKTKTVPHGWGVAHFLSGHAGGGKKKPQQKNWLERNSIEAQFKSLQLVKAMKQQEREERLATQILARQGTLNTLRSMEGARGYAKRHAELSLLEEKTQVFYARYQAEIVLREREEALLFVEETRVNELIAKEKVELQAQGQRLHELQQQVPEVVAEVQLMASTKTALEFLRVGGHFEVEYDDELWYTCEIVALDVYDTMVADVLYVDDQRREKIKLVEASVLEEHKAFQALQLAKKPRTVASITAAAAAKAAAAEIPFRRWRAGKAIEISWEAPSDNGATITQYVVEWRDEANEDIKGTSIVTGDQRGADDDDHSDEDENDDGDAEPSVRSVVPPPTTTTLWPILEQCEKTLRVRVAAQNRKGGGLASVYMALPEELLVDVSYRTAVPLIAPPPDTSAQEKRERAAMEQEDTASSNLRFELTCTICKRSDFGFAHDVHEHVARDHAVPLICPFKSCQQVCASERALRYHMWRCSIAKPTIEEAQSELFLEIFNISRQYCMRKDRRHVGRMKPRASVDASDQETEMTTAIAEEVFMERKFDDAKTAWFARARAIHERNLLANARDRDRTKQNRYTPPTALYGLDFVDPELNVARREAVLATIQILQADLDAFRLETTTQLDKLRHEEKELQDYIALKTKRMKTTEEEWQKQSLKREKKKAQKTLDQVQANLQLLITTSTQRIEEMTNEIQRLTVIEKAFVPFTHQLVRVNRLGTVIQTTHATSQSIMATHKVILDSYQDDLRKLLHRAVNEVVKLDAWDAMIEARRRQLQALKDELRRLQVLHLAEVESFRRKRDDGDERFQLTKLRQQQSAVLKRRDLATEAMLALSKKQSRGDIARTKAAIVAAESTDLVADLVVKSPSLQIANHDMQMHERFIKGKSADVEYLKDDPKNADKAGDNVGGGRALVEAVTQAEGGREGGGGGGGGATAAGESSAEQQQHEDEDGALDGDEADAAYELALVAAQQKKKKKSRPRLRELPHSYIRLECDFQDGQIRGNVRIEYNEGSVYEGPWVDDTSYDKPVDAAPFKTRYTANHWGKFTFHDGTVWQGEDVDNFFSPFTATGSNFQVTTRDGHEYTGDVRAGKYHGFGTLKMNYTFSQGEYVGEWCEGKRHGYGIERFDIGELYEGYWELDLYHGHGEMVYDDGSRYEGQFKHGKWHGEGVRSLATGDRIIGVFEDGYLNGAGMMEFADKRNYAGEFQFTRRHGLGSLTFANGDRYDGPFENDEMHGEGKWITKQAEGEPLVRLGKWVRGERVAWLSKASTQLATATFIQYFAVTKNVSGEIEMDLLPPKFKTPYAVMVAGMLPNLPEGVDASDAFVQSIVRMLAKTQSVVVGAEILEKTTTDHAEATVVVNTLREEYEALRNDVEIVDRETRAQARKVSELQDELDDKSTKEQDMQAKVEHFWKYQDSQQLERKYKQAVEQLNQCDVMDWYKLRTATLDDVYLSLLEAFAVLLNFTTNFYLDGKMYCPSKQDLVMLLSSNEENVHMGDKEGLIHRYNVKALYVLPLFDVYSFGDGVRNQMLHSITHVIHHPRLRPNNVRLYQISPAFAAVCAWVRAAFFYAKKAIEICPVVKRMMDQLIVVEHVRRAVETERVALKTIQEQADVARLRLERKREQLQESEQKQQALAKIIADIEALDAAEYTPMEKSHIKKPQSYRPPSAGIAPPPKSEGDEDEDDEDDDATKNERAAAMAQAAAAPQINRRQVFEEDHATYQTERLQKEQVLMRILENAELAQELELLKKEVHKVIDRCGGKVPVAEFPKQFEEIMLKPLDPMLFGIKKMRTLLLLMEDVCVVVEPERDGEVETVQFPMDADDGEPMAPRQRCFCRLCPGVSYATPQELAFHERTKWHYWNLMAKHEGRALQKYTLKATYWSEVYDSSDNSICFYNTMTGEMVKSDEPPLEMQANELMMELLKDE